MLSGAGITKAGDDADDRIMVHTTFDLPILDGGQVKIDLETAGDNHDIKIDDETPVFGMIMDENGCGVVPCTLAVVEDESPESNCGVYVISRQQPLVLQSAEAAKYVGHTIRVDCYCEKTNGAVEMTIDAKNFAGNYYVEASTLWRDQNGEDFPMEIVIPNVKIQSNFTFSMAASGDPSTFTFTMDAFPAYPKFNKKKKAFAVMQLIGDDSLVPSDPIAEEEATCTPLAVNLSAKAGTAGWTDISFGDSDPLNVKFSTLGSRLGVIQDRANLDFTGSLRHIENWKAFSSLPEDLTGYYIPVTFESAASEDGKIPAADTLITYPKGYKGQAKEIPFTDGKVEMILAVDPNSPVITVEAKSADKTQEYTLDFCQINFK